ncbi:hypothetical protein AB0L40_17470 [Patulibacter sp. NPDC049589]|uniref:hypothetical protein n=1 Tax=Patulibacter sp. NPDC049589 TaxID=3154731 RepID=UPI00341BD919
MKTITPLTTLSERALQVEHAVNGAASRTREELVDQVSGARDAAQHGASGLQAGAAVVRDEVSGWWKDLHQSWATNVARIRKTEDHAKADHDAADAEARADRADADADAALALAYAALDEAEYAILDSSLARMDARDARDAV